MIKYSIKRPTDRTGVWEWKSVQGENTTYVEIVKYNTKEEADSAKEEWAPKDGVVVEVNVPDAE